MIIKLRFLIVEDLHFCQTILTFQLLDLNFNILKFVYKLLSHQIKLRYLLGCCNLVFLL